jgi:hypothetical protein
MLVLIGTVLVIGIAIYIFLFVVGLIIYCLALICWVLLYIGLSVYFVLYTFWFFLVSLYTYLQYPLYKIGISKSYYFRYRRLLKGIGCRSILSGNGTDFTRVKITRDNLKYFIDLDRLVAKINDALMGSNQFRKMMFGFSHRLYFVKKETFRYSRRVVPIVT